MACRAVAYGAAQSLFLTTKSMGNTLYRICPAYAPTHVCPPPPVGAGKSTIMGLLSGELRPSSGRVLIGGADLFASPEARGAVAYCPQVCAHLLAVLAVVVVSSGPDAVVYLLAPRCQADPPWLPCPGL